MTHIDNFVAQVRDVFKNTRDVRRQAQDIANALLVLIADPGLLDEIKNLGGATPGRINLHIDDLYGQPEAGFCLMTSLTPKGKSTGGAKAHDHGASFVVYGVFKGAIKQTKYGWYYPNPSDLLSPELRPTESFVQNAGEVAFFLPGEIHNTSAIGDENPIVLRLEAQMLSHVKRHSYDIVENQVFGR